MANTQLFLHMLCVGLQHVNPLHTSQSVCTKPLWPQVPSSPRQDLLLKRKKYWASIHPPLFLRSSVLLSFYHLFLQRVEGRVHTASTWKRTTPKQASKWQGDINAQSSGVVKKFRAALFISLSQAACGKTLVDHSPPPVWPLTYCSCKLGTANAETKLSGT